MKIIVGLGNPGDKYKNTRHNVGFMFLDFFALKNNFPDFNYESKFKGEISKKTYKSEKIILLKPQTFMNLSGESLQKICNYYKLNYKDFIVLYDDISLNFGKIRFREKGRAGGHNGIKDIIRFFKEDFKRIKIGVGLDEKYEVSDWVLSKFNEEELIELENEVFPKGVEILEEKLTVERKRE